MTEHGMKTESDTVENDLAIVTPTILSEDFKEFE